MIRPEHQDYERPVKILRDGRGVWIFELTFQRGRLALGRLDQPLLDDEW